jgi:hypothetical protein
MMNFSKNNPKINVFVVHAKYLANRIPLMQTLITLLQQADIVNSIKIYTDKDPGEILPEDVGKFSNQPIEDGPLAYFNAVMKPMSIVQISNALKHKMILEDIVAQAASSDTNHDNDEDSRPMINLVLEDDALFSDDIAVKLMEAVDIYYGGNNGIMFLGLPAPKSDKTTIGNVMDVYKVLPSCDSFFIDAPTARTILNEYDTFRIRFPTNIQMTYTFLKTNTDIKMLMPCIFMDGTKFGTFHSNLELNGRLQFNPYYMMLADLIVNAPLPPEDGVGGYADADKERIDKLFEEAQYKSHVEYYYLKAKYETRKGNFEFALSLYKYTLDLSEKMGIPMTQGSEFMKDYMKLYREFQD